MSVVNASLPTTCSHSSLTSLEDNADSDRRIGLYTGRILKGAKPGELPIHQPTEFELVINLKAAKSLGIPIPDSMLLRADGLIQ